MHIRHNQAYGPHPRQIVDVYEPAHNPTGTVVVFWHGGSWQRGRPSRYAFVGRALAGLGYTAVVAGYRLYPEARWPQFAEDAAAAVAWCVRELAPRRLVATGHSAGGQIAAAVALDPQYLEAAGVPGAVHGLVGLAGAYSFRPGTGAIRAALETDGRPWQTPQLISGPPVPALLVHGRRDRIIGAHVTEQLAAALRQRGGRVETVFYPRLAHFSLMAPLLLGWWIAPSLKRHITSFIDSLV